MWIALLLAALPGPGTWTLRHPVPMPALGDKVTCKDGGGQWVDSACQRDDAADVVRIGPAEGGVHRVQVTTVTANLRTCTFDGVGVVEGKQLIATQRVKLPGQAHATCTLQLSLRGDELDVFVPDPTPCANLCGPMGSLEVEGATR